MTNLLNKQTLGIDMGEEIKENRAIIINCKEDSVYMNSKESEKLTADINKAING